MPATVRESIERIQAQARHDSDRYLYERARQNRDSKSIQHYLGAAPLKSMGSEMAAYLKWLHDREGKTPLVFKLVEVKWQDAKSYWTGKTRVELFVNGSTDDRNHSEEGLIDPRGQIYDWDGFRRVTVNVAQTEAVGITFKVWHVAALGGWEELLEYHRNITGEDLDV